MNKKASMTVEAALVLPVFLFAMVLTAYLGLLMKCQDEVQWAMTRTVREASAECGAKESELFKSSVYYRAKLEAYLKGTGLTVSLSESKFLEENDELDLIVTYRVSLPFRLLPGGYRFRQRVHTRAFTGVETRDGDGPADDTIVYVTETGRVYHKSLECTYLKLSISQVKYADVEGLRNEGGGKYKPCERCAENKSLAPGAAVWITNYGDRYHCNRACSGIKRSIREIKMSEVGTRTPCSKCGS